MDQNFSCTDHSILVVDDSPLNLKLLSTVLEGQGYDVAMVQNGKDAFLYLESEKPDLILLDIMMPEMDGYEVCLELKKKPDLKWIPVIFLTAKTEIEDIVKGFESGGVDYITKPFNSHELLARVKTHIQLKNAREEILRLRGMIPMCANCKKIRDDKGFWNHVEQYIEERSEVQISHGICPECIEELYPDRHTWNTDDDEDD